MAGRVNHWVEGLLIKPFTAGNAAAAERSDEQVRLVSAWQRVLRVRTLCGSVVLAPLWSSLLNPLLISSLHWSLLLCK